MSEIERMVEASRHSDAPLHVRLQALKEMIDDQSPEFASAMGDFVDRLAVAKAGSAVPQIGDPMPNFVLPDESGNLVSLDGLLAENPVVVTFHRGHWCPYCRMSVDALAHMQPKPQSAKIVAISGELPTFSKKLKAEAEADFPFLTDLELGYALSLNLAIWVDDLTAKFIADSGFDVADYQGSAGWILPIPAVFAVSQDGIIRARHIDPDYRRRMDTEDIAAMAALLA